MKYELAKELQEAGFPGSEIWFQFGKNEPLLPSLSELIEACGMGLFIKEFQLSQRRVGFDWQAACVVIDPGLCNVDPMLDGFAATPEEAVAKLWLALNKK